MEYEPLPMKGERVTGLVWILDPEWGRERVQFIYLVFPDLRDYDIGGYCCDACLIEDVREDLGSKAALAAEELAKLIFLLGEDTDDDDPDGSTGGPEAQQG